MGEVGAGTGRGAGGRALGRGETSRGDGLVRGEEERSRSYGQGRGELWRLWVREKGSGLGAMGKGGETSRGDG